MWELGKYDVVAANLMKEVPHTVNTNFVDYGINSDELIVFEPWAVIVKINLNGVEKFNKLLMSEIYALYPNNIIILMLENIWI